MKIKNLSILIMLAFFFLLIPGAKVQASDATVVFFHSVTCPACVIVEKYLLAEAKTGKFSLLEFENSSFPNLRAEFDTSFSVVSSAKNSIPIIFVGRQYLYNAAIKSQLATVLTFLKPADYAYPLTFLTDSKNYTATPPSSPLFTFTKARVESHRFSCLLLLTLAILFLPFYYRKRKKA